MSWAEGLPREKKKPSVITRLGPEKTKSNAYRSVNWLVTLHVAVLARAVVGLAEGHARNAAGDQTCRLLAVTAISASLESRGNHVQRSTGAKQEKKPVLHGRASGGDGAENFSVLAKVLLKRSFQSSISRLSMGPPAAFWSDIVIRWRK